MVPISHTRLAFNETPRHLPQRDAIHLPSELLCRSHEAKNPKSKLQKNVTSHPLSPRASVAMYQTRKSSPRNQLATIPLAAQVRQWPKHPLVQMLQRNTKDRMLVVSAH